MAEGRDITAEVKRIIKEQLDVDEKDIKAEATFIDDLGADSLGLVELVLAFEEAFEIDIPDEDTETIMAVQLAITDIEVHTQKQRRALPRHSLRWGRQRPSTQAGSLREPWTPRHSGALDDGVAKPALGVR